MCRKCYGQFKSINAENVIDGYHWLWCWEDLARKTSLSIFILSVLYGIV